MTPQLINSASLGSAFAREYGITIAFVAKCFSYEKEGSRRGYSFDQISGSLGARNNEQESKGDPSHGCCRFTRDFLSPFRQVSGLYRKIRPRPLRSISFPIHYSGRVGAKVVSRPLPKVGANIRFQDRSCGICSGLCGIGVVSFRAINSSAFINHFMNPRTRSFRTDSVGVFAS
jgi:hypothetical protein